MPESAVLEVGGPRAARLRPPSWRDPRLLVGLVLVLASVALGARVVAAADDTTPVWAAATSLPAGRALAAGDLRAVRVHLGSGTAAYLPASSALPGGSVLLRGLGAGELVPAAAVGPASAFDRRPVALALPGPPPEGVGPGARVDVWSSARDPGVATGPAYRQPVLLARAAEVASVRAPAAGLAASSGTAVQVLLRPQEVPAALDALANAARLALVPVPGAAAGDVQ